MKNIQNKALANESLNIKGATYVGDHEGVFEMEDEHAEMLLGTPGWSSSMRPPEEAPAAFDPVAAMAGGDELVAVQTALQNALGDVGRLETKLQTSKALRADLQLAVQSKDAEIKQLKAAAKAPVASASPTVSPAPGATSAGETASKGNGAAAEEEGPQLDGMDKPQLLAAATKWEVELTSAQMKLGADKLRTVLDKAIYGD